MPIMGNRFGGNAIPKNNVTPEERMLKNERKRVEDYIRAYERNPKSFNQGMISQLEQLAMQYQIPFKRVIPTAGIGRQIGAGAMGVVDSALFDLVPDAWYSSEATRQAANIGKLGGAGTQIAAAIAATVLSGGAASPSIMAALGNVGKAAGSVGSAVRGVSGLAKAGQALKGMGTVGKELGKLGINVASKGLIGRATGGALRAGARSLAPYGAKQGWKWADDLTNAQILTRQTQTIATAKESITKGTGKLSDILKGQNLTPAQIKELRKFIRDTHSVKSGKGMKLTKTGKEFTRQLDAGVEGASINLGLTPDQMHSFINSIRLTGNPKITLKRIQKIAKDAKIPLTKGQAQKIADELASKGHTRFKDTIPTLLNMGSSPATADATLRGLANMDTLGALAGAGFTAGTVAGMRTPSREELERTQDPMDPYNY